MTVEIADFETPLESSVIEQCLRETAGSSTSTWLEESLPRNKGPSFMAQTFRFGNPEIASNLGLIKSASGC